VKASLDVLGVLYLVWGAMIFLFGVLFGGLYMLIGGGVGVLLGGLGAATGDGEALMVGLINAVVFIVIGLIALVIAAVIALPSLAAGWGIRNRKPWARIVALVVGGLSLPSVPLGTALGVFAFVTLLKPEAAAEFGGNPPALE